MIAAVIDLHAGIGELSALAFLWIVVELLEPTVTRLRRAMRVALFGFTAVVINWILAGFMSLSKGSVVPHSLPLQIKENIFLLLPFLSIFIFMLLRQGSREIILDKTTRRRAILLSVLAFVLTIIIIGLGHFATYSSRAGTT